MAAFNKNSLAQVSGFGNPIITGELVAGQRTYWGLTITAPSGNPVDLTGATLDAQILRRQISNLTDTRNGLSFTIADYTASTPSAISLTIANRVDSNGTFQILIDESAWSVISSDAQLDIAINDCVAFSGRLKITFPATSSTPVDDSIIFLLFLVRSDGVVN